jgi:hypothetical protein
MASTPTGTTKCTGYRSYLLRLWQEEGGQQLWRASLQSTETGERRGFASLDALLGFLREQVESRDEPPPRQEPGTEGR